MWSYDLACGSQQVQIKCEKGAAGSEAACPGTCVGAHVAGQLQYYRNKLEATLRILRNREETLRVQNESLRGAEERLAEAAQRDNHLNSQLRNVQHELNNLRRQTAAATKAVEVSIQATDCNDAVKTLENNFAVVQKLYRDCFYEAAKQQDMIEMLRKSYLDVRLMEKDKSHRIEELKEKIKSQRWSFDKCQGIVADVENLKSEIISYLNSTNNDSGVWERCEDPLAMEVGEDLNDILQQLVTLRDMLKSECTCGLREENARLQDENQMLNAQMAQMRGRKAALEASLEERSCCITRCKEQLKIKDEQVCQLQSALAALEMKLRQATTLEPEILRCQLDQARETAEAKTEELEQMQAECEARDTTIKILKEQLRKAEHAVKENSEVRSEVSQLSCQVREWREQLAQSTERVRGLEEDLTATRQRCHQLERCYREKAECATRLQAELAEATERGAELCDESRRVVGALRCWTRRMRDTHARQQRKLEEQEATLYELRRRLAARDGRIESARSAECPSQCRPDAALPTRLPRILRRRNKTLAEERVRRNWAECCGRTGAGASSPDSPSSSPTSTSAYPLICRTHRARQLELESLPHESPTEVLMSRVEHLQAALASGRQRWTRPPPRPPTPRI